MTIEQNFSTNSTKYSARGPTSQAPQKVRSNYSLFQKPNPLKISIKPIKPDKPRLAKTMYKKAWKKIQYFAQKKYPS